MAYTAWIWLSNSRLKDFMRCHRFHRLAWIDRRVLKIKPAPLMFGTAFGNALEVWEQGRSKPIPIVDALEVWRRGAINSESILTTFDVVAGDVLLRGYHASWADDELTTIDTEVEWTAPLLNPYTGGYSRTFRLIGHFDAVVRDSEDRLHIKERKTTSEDIELGSIFWDKLRSNPQAGTYFDNGTRHLGERVNSVLFDVVRKPTFKPYTATPMASQKFTKGRLCKVCAALGHTAELDDRGCTTGHYPTGNNLGCPVCSGTCYEVVPHLYANLRSDDETPAEYGDRLADDMLAVPEKYFARKPIVRLAEEIEAARVDTWEQAEIMRHQMRQGHAPRNRNACYDFKRRCEYHEVCFGTQRLDDDTIFCDNAHPDRPTNAKRRANVRRHDRQNGDSP